MTVDHVPKFNGGITMALKNNRFKTKVAGSLLAVGLFASTPAVAGPVTGIAAIPYAEAMCMFIASPIGMGACALGWAGVGLGWLPFWP